MQTKTIFKLISASLISLILTACGGGGGSALDNTLNGVTLGANSSSSSSAVNSDTLQSIEFSDAKPELINLKGTGGAESSLVRFRTLGQTGLPIKGIKVSFALTSTVGGLALSQDSATSDKDGYISTSVISGTISTSVRVAAIVVDTPAISTQSSLLVISTGLPDQKSMSLALEKFNVAGWDYIGTESNVSVRLADAYNNPAADGTAVYFTTEGGSIDSSCTTENGVCSVKWRSQDPRPPRTSSDNSIARILCLNLSGAELRTCEAERAGRSTILATAIGNESFKDQNGNGIFDVNLDLPVFKTSQDSNCTRSAPLSSFESTEFACDDLAEAYLDTNENGVHDAGEHFINFITDTANDLTEDNYTLNNGIYNGAFCQPADEAAEKCSRSPITIRKQHLIIMSCMSTLLENGFLPLIGNESGRNIYAIADCNGNPLPVDSTITVGTGTEFKILNQYSWTAVSAPPSTIIKLSIVGQGGATKEMQFTTPSN